MSRFLELIEKGQFVFCRQRAVERVVSTTHRIRIGFRRRWREFAGWTLGGLGTAVAVLEPLTLFFGPVRAFLDAYGHLLFPGCFVVALCYAILRVTEPVSISFSIKTTNTTVEILFGDIFAQHGHIAIPANEYFDGQLGQRVDPNSVHGQFVQRYFRSEGTKFETACDNALPKQHATSSARVGPRKRKYPIGTTACVPVGSQIAFVFALSLTDPETSKARANVPIMWQALEGLWRAVRVHSNGQCVCLPLVGAGQSSVGLEPNHLLRIILLSILTSTREGEITKKIVIVLHESVFDRIDLRALKRDWG